MKCIYIIRRVGSHKRGALLIDSDIPPVELPLMIYVRAGCYFYDTVSYRLFGILLSFVILFS